MKHHFMRISSVSVRIELIPEHDSEKTLLKQLKHSQVDDLQLAQLFENALAHYQLGSILTAKTFMNFPYVALCNFDYSEIHAASTL